MGIWPLVLSTSANEHVLTANNEKDPDLHRGLFRDAL